MNVEEYLEASGLSPEAFGELIGHHGTTVRRWIKGADIKTSDINKMIAITGGKITAEALLRANGKAA